MTLAYCDLIANIVYNKLNGHSGEGISLLEKNKFKSDKPILDLHPEEGYMISTKRTLMVTDPRGTTYKITIEEAE